MDGGVGTMNAVLVWLKPIDRPVHPGGISSCRLFRAGFKGPAGPGAMFRECAHKPVGLENQPGMHAI
jgi:hypothetical protein